MGGGDNLSFYEKIRKIICKLSLLLLYIWNTMCCSFIIFIVIHCFSWADFKVKQIVLIVKKWLYLSLRNGCRPCLAVNRICVYRLIMKLNDFIVCSMTSGIEILVLLVRYCGPWQHKHCVEFSG